VGSIYLSSLKSYDLSQKIRGRVLIYSSLFSFYGVIILKKTINEYNWLKDYSKNQIGIKVCGKWMYPSKKPLRTCCNCQFLMTRESNYTFYCFYGCPQKEGKLNKKNKIYPIPTDICFPCKTNWIYPSVLTDSLSVAIEMLCLKEEKEDEFSLEDLLK